MPQPAIQISVLKAAGELLAPGSGLPDNQPLLLGLQAPPVMSVLHSQSSLPQPVSVVFVQLPRHAVLHFLLLMSRKNVFSDLFPQLKMSLKPE